MARLCITVDLDRDANVEVPGRVAAGSMDRGEGDSPRFSSAGRGLRLLADALNEAGLPATFFCEGRTLEALRDEAGLLDGFEAGVHGYEHEDLAHLEYGAAEAAIGHGRDAVRDVLGRSPTCFRAPYMRPPERLSEMLAAAGIRVDSSSYATGKDRRVSGLGHGVSEVPVAEQALPSGARRSGYLWPMHEGKRAPESYLGLLENLPDDGVLVIADHAWHVCETRRGGVLDDAGARASVEQTVEVASILADAGLRPTTLSGAVHRRTFCNKPSRASRANYISGTGMGVR